MNMKPTGLITNNASALSIISGNNETNYCLFEANHFGNLLRGGANLLAVELHQVTSASTLDATFDLELVGTAAPSQPGGPPVLKIASIDSGIQLSWTNTAVIL